MGNWMMKNGVAFALQLTICMAAFVCRFPRREHFRLRVFFSAAFLLSFTYCVFQLLHIWPGVQQFLTFLVFEIVWGAAFAGILVCFAVKPFYALYAAIGGYALQHLIYGAFSIIRYYAPDMPGILSDILFFLPYILASIGFYQLYIKRNSDYNNQEEKSAFAVGLAVIVIILNVFLSRLASSGYSNDAFLSTVVCRLYSVLCCILVLAELFGVFRQNSLERDKMIMEHLIMQSKDQQQIIGDSLDFINIKCHDLKKQITSLKKIASTRERNEMIEELEQSVQLYDSAAKTGNAAIDLVFTEISWRCLKNSVKFDYIIDGSDYDFMVMEDIYSMFFNALDNAIESVEREEDTDKRMISLKSVLQGDLLYVQVLNYCTLKPEFKDGLPLTTKKDGSNLHGFGTKSLRYIAEKYGGSVRMGLTDDGFFDLEILLKRTEQK